MKLLKSKWIFIVFLIISVILEIFVFNYKWLSSVANEPLKRAAAVEFMPDRKNPIRQLFEIQLDEIDSTIENIYIPVNPGKGSKTEIHISAMDEANADYLSAPPHIIADKVPASQYIRLHYSGKVSSLKITLDKSNCDMIDVNGIRFNVKIPFMPSLPRLSVVFAILSLAYILRPSSAIYAIKTDLRRRRQRLICVLLGTVILSGFIAITQLNPTALSWHTDNVNHQQYYNVIEALKQGQLSFAEGSEELKELDNPYDYYARRLNNTSFKWDNAYYKGKYYSYFGIAPALLLYLPYNLITGQHLPNYTAVYIFAALIILGFMLLLWEIIKKWFKDIPFAIYLLMAFVVPWASVLSYAAYKPDFYIVPPMAALMFSIFGLAMWIGAEKEDGSLKASRMAWGSLFIALTSACRPQFLISIAFGIILFTPQVFKKRTLFSACSIRQTAALCIPFMLVGAAVMWYNYARFESPFDFGANYNLTSNDMTHRGFVPGRIGLGIFSYFLQPLQINAVFPFLHDFKCETSYQGLTLAEEMIGGVLWLYPLLAMSLYGAAKKQLFARDLRLYTISVSAVILSVIVAVVDAQMAGLLTRYFTDYVWMLMLGAVLTIFAMYDRPKTGRKRVNKVIISLAAATVILSLLSIFAHSDQSIERHNPYMYYTIQHLIAFWS